MIFNIFRKKKDVKSPKKKVSKKPSDEIINATYEKGVMKLIYQDDKTIEYAGNCTSWRKLPFMDEVKVHSEINELLRIEKYIDFHGNPYPTAHLNKTRDNERM